MSSDLWTSLIAILPLIVLSVWAIILLLVDLVIPDGRKGWTAFLAALGLLVVLGMVLAQVGGLGLFAHTIYRSNTVAPGGHESAFNGMIVVDGFANFINVLLLLSGLAGVFLAYDFLKRTGIERGEYYVLLLFAIIGMMVMGMSADLIIVFLALEMLSIPLYVLAGIAVPRLNSEEASIKYFLLGAFSSGFFLYGVALLYGATGATALNTIRDVVEAGAYNSTLLLSGAALIVVGLGFKVALVPFHMWTPDVYQGAPTSVTAFMAVGAKVAGFAALLRIFTLAFPVLFPRLMPVLWGLAALTMIVGNLVAISQSNVKRLLAYSSIAHAGYILMALVPIGKEGVAVSSVASALFYLVAYAFTSFAAWAVVIALEQSGENGLELDNYAGLGHKHPGLAAVMAVAMLSFIGVPPTLGFVGKFYLFRTTLEGGFVGLALIGVLTSLVSAYYYLRVVVIMYMQEGDPVVRREPRLYAVAYAAAICIFLLGIFSAPLLYLASLAVTSLF
jgi:NADH-quinone oxidoreductase subunit N